MFSLKVEFLWHTLFPKHVDHFMLVFISKFSVQGKWIQVLCHKQVNVENKILVVEIFLIYTNICNIRKKVSRFNSCCRVFFPGGLLSWKKSRLVADSSIGWTLFSVWSVINCFSETRWIIPPHWTMSFLKSLNSSLFSEYILLCIFTLSTTLK